MPKFKKNTSPAMYKKSGFKMKGNPFKRNFGSFEEQKAKQLEIYKNEEIRAMEGFNLAKEDYESGYSEGIRNIYHSNEEKVIEPKKKKWYQRKPKGERNRKTWWNPFD